MNADDGAVVTLEAILRESDEWVGRVVRIRGILQATSTEARLVSGADAVSVEMEKGSIARELIRCGVAPYVGGPLLYDHEVIISAVLSRRMDGSLSLRRIIGMTVSPGKTNEEKVIAFT